MELNEYLDMDASAAKLKNIGVDKIVRNPHNPRILFRQEEMDELLDSIKKYGVLVPISVYKQGQTFVLIDGERRWRCCSKLNRKIIPAMIQAKPDAFTNVLLMFNIHALREQWDLLTIALKLREIIKHLEKTLGKAPSETVIAEQTGLKRSVVRRCNFLLKLPTKYHAMILKELTKPKRRQKITEDFFIEMEKALTTVERSMPELLPDKDKIRRILIAKHRNKTIENRVAFRKVAKIARAHAVDADPKRARRALKKLFEANKYGIEQAFEDSVSSAYAERDIEARLRALIERFRDLEYSDLDETTRECLQELIVEARRLLGDGR